MAENSQPASASDFALALHHEDGRIILSFDVNVIVAQAVETILERRGLANELEPASPMPEASEADEQREVLMLLAGILWQVIAMAVGPERMSVLFGNRAKPWPGDAGMVELLAGLLMKIVPITTARDELSMGITDESASNLQEWAIAEFLKAARGMPYTRWASAIIFQAEQRLRAKT